MLSANTPPHSTELEQSVLGCLLIDSDAMLKVLGRLNANDFYDPAHREIYAAVCELFEEGSAVDLLTLKARLADSKRINAAGGSAYLAELAAVVPTAANIERYAETVIAHSRRRQLISLGR